MGNDEMLERLREMQAGQQTKAVDDLVERLRSAWKASSLAPQAADCLETLKAEADLLRQQLRYLLKVTEDQSVRIVFLNRDLAEARVRTLAWLGHWRDEMPAEAVKDLQALIKTDSLNKGGGG